MDIAELQDRKLDPKLEERKQMHPINVWVRN